jgi:hypothetical protein
MCELLEDGGDGELTTSIDFSLLLSVGSVEEAEGSEGLEGWVCVAQITKAWDSMAYIRVAAIAASVENDHGSHPWY